MKKYRFKNMMGVFTVIMVLLFASGVRAAEYNVTADFSTDSSIWGDGDAIIDYSKFWGVEWDEYWSFNHLSRNVESIWGINVGDYGLEASFDTNGRIGLQLDVFINSGLMDISTPLNITLNDGSGSTGGTQTISTEYSTQSGAGFTTSDMGGSIKADLIFDAYARVEAEGCIIWCVDDAFTIIDEHLSYNLIDLNSDSDLPTYHDTFLGGTIDVFAQIPNVSTVSYQSGPITFESSGEDTALNVSIDLDKAITFFTGVPLGLDWDFNPYGDIGFGFDVDLLDVGLSANLSLNQAFTVSMSPTVSLAFDSPVYVQGEFGDWFATIDTMQILGNDFVISTNNIVPIQATPTYTTSWNISNSTTAKITSNLDITIGELDIWADWYFGDDTWHAGPLYQESFELFSYEMFLYGSAWSTEQQSILGDTFYIDSIPYSLEFSTLDDFMMARSDDGTFDFESRNTFMDLVSTYAEGTSGVTQSDLLTENPELLNFVSMFLDLDSTRVDYLNDEATAGLCGLFTSYYISCDDYLSFMDGDVPLGIDFQPIFTGDLLTGLSLTFFDLTGEEDDLFDLGFADLMNTSLVFFFNEEVGKTDVSVYQRFDDNMFFDFTYTSMTARLAPVPEPGTLLLLGCGLIGLVVWRRRLSA